MESRMERDGYRFIDGGVTAAKEFYANGVYCGIKRAMKAGDVVTAGSVDANEPKQKQKRDVGAIFSSRPCAAAAVYTTNKVKAAPILVTKQHLADGKARAVIVNSGNANACNANGDAVANEMCALLARALDIKPDEVIVASTGVIGVPLPVEAIGTGIDHLCSALSAEGGAYAAEAIMTTDTFAKQAAVSFEIGGVTCTIGGMAKGSGMIHPNMATMLGFLTTDCDIAPALLQQALSDCVSDTFNMVSVDGDTSTNDMACILANGAAGNPAITAGGDGYDTFHAALLAVATSLARMLAKDGEGATKLIECTVKGAPDQHAAKTAAKSVIGSSLFKAAMFGRDANWGRILCALGYADAAFAIDAVEVTIASAAGEVKVC
ncbi:MAG: bifunctional glutamate N-acetyltransferase/amino-acid acetyltransferase ArgJ, partial [Acetanaerobacterium sp.]